MSEENQGSSLAFRTVSQIIEQLEALSKDDREHVVRTVSTWFRIGTHLPSQSLKASTENQDPSPTAHLNTPSDEKFSNRAIQSVKDFIFEKDPVTESERLACLAFYLTHYLETPSFKTVDLSRLNTEAAQRKMSNPAVAAGNATRDGFFVQATKVGHKQLSAMGERFVQLLPDREAASKVRQKMSTRRKKSGAKTSSIKSVDSEEQ